MTIDELRGIPFQDLYKLKEDDRITLIGHYVMEHSKRVAFMTDCGPGDEDKPDRYIRKIKERFPDVQIISVTDGPVANVKTIALGPKTASA